MCVLPAAQKQTIKRNNSDLTILRYIVRVARFSASVGNLIRATIDVQSFLRCFLIEKSPINVSLLIKLRVVEGDKGFLSAAFQRAIYIDYEPRHK